MSPCAPISLDQFNQRVFACQDKVFTLAFYIPGNTTAGYLFGDFNLYYGYLEPNLKFAVSYAYDMQDVLIERKTTSSFMSKLEI